MKLLVTGGAGFIGSNFIRYWLKNHPSDEIVSLDKLTYAGHLSSTRDFGNNSNYKFIKGDICDPEVVEKAMDGADVVMGFAAESHVDRSIVGPKVFLQTNVIGTQVLLDAAVKHKIKRFHHISCYDRLTRAYTKRGLKYYWELRDNDEVLSLNMETKQIEWKKIKKIIVQDYEGGVINLNTDKLNFKVTPNHRMLLQTPKAKKLIFKEASRLGSVNIFPRGSWRSNTKIDKNLMYLLGVFIGDGFLAYQEKYQKNKSGLSKKDYIKIARDKKNGRFISMNYVGKQKTTVMKSYRIFLDIPLKDKCRKKLERVLSELGLNWHSHSGKAGEHLYFASKKFSDMFKSCGKGALNKTIPRWALKADIESLRALFDGLIDSDGHWGACPCFCTSSARLSETFSELCVKLEFIPHVFERKKQENLYQGRLIRGGKSYLISVTRQQRTVRIGKGLNQISEGLYKGKVWCVTVPENKNLLVERNGAFIFCGNTDEVFGALSLDSKEKFNEKTLYDPHSPYSASKAASDHLVRAYFYTYGLPITITNCSNNFGPYQDPEKFIPRAITNLIEGKEIPLYGDGKYVRDWLFVEDHIRAIEVVLEEGKAGETYLVGGLTEDIDHLEVAGKLLKIFKKEEESIKFVKDRPGHDRCYSVDWGKIKKELGWQPKFGFDEWLAKTVDWYKKNEWWWRPLKEEAERLYEKTGQR